jgi:hypothetical protein
LLVGGEIQQQQRAFGEQCVAAHCSQIVQQRQEHERHVAPAAHHSFEVSRQLDHRAHQRIEALVQMPLLLEVVDEIARDLLHLFGKQGRAIHFGDTQRTMHAVQALAALAQQIEILLLLTECLERRTRLIELRRELARDDMQSLRGNFAHRYPPWQSGALRRSDHSPSF